LDILLREETATYEGKYFHNKKSTVNPPAIQQPRPPITIGALGPKMLKLTIQYADQWNSYGCDSLNEDEM
jgi:alkanesulfonate monooxygenase SsuD/methylene tetrahydromethanopterin reductase-like flavin-dependent oxidoreductase (luciferase family)